MSHNFFKGAALLASVEILLRLKGFIFMPIITRSYGPVSYGVWSQLTMLTAALTPLIIFCTDSAIMRYLPGKSDSELRAEFSAWFYYILTAGFFVAIATLLFGNFFARLIFGGTEGFSQFVPLASMSLVTSLINLSYMNWLKLKNNIKSLALITLWRGLSDLFVIGLCLATDQSLFVLVASSMVPELLLALFVCKKYHSAGFFRLKPELQTIPILLRFGLPLVPAGFAMWGLNWFDRMYLAQHVDMIQIGMYAVSYNLGYMLIQTIVNPIWSMFPSQAGNLFNNGKLTEIDELLRKSVHLILFLVLPSIVGLYFVGEEVLSLFAGSQFAMSGQIIWAILAGYLAHMLSSFYDVLLNLLHKQILSVGALFFAVLVNVLGCIILIPKIGISGAAYSTFAGFCVQLLIVWTLASRNFQMVSVMRSAGLNILCSLILWVGLFFLEKLLLLRGVNSTIPLIPSGILLYITAAHYLKILDFPYLRSMVSSRLS